MSFRLGYALFLVALALLVGCDGRSKELDDERTQLRTERDLLKSQLALKQQRQAELTPTEQAEGARMGLRLREIENRLDGIEVEEKNRESHSQ